MSRQEVIKRRNRLYKIKDILNKIGSILIGIVVFLFIGLAGAIDAEAYGGDPVTNLKMRICVIAAALVLAIAAKFVSGYIE